MSDDLIEKYNQLSLGVAKLEAELELTRTQRGLVAGQLLARDGKGRGYDLGDGVLMIVCSTKVGTHYLVARNKWGKQGRPVPPAVGPVAVEAVPTQHIEVKQDVETSGVVIEKVKEPKAAKEPKPEKLLKVAVKRSIVNGQIVEVPVEPRRASVPPPPPPAPEVSVASAQTAPIVSEPVSEPVAEPSVVQAAPAPAAEAEPPTVVTPEPSPSIAVPGEEIDPLDAALAALDM